MFKHIQKNEEDNGTQVPINQLQHQLSTRGQTLPLSPVDYFKANPNCHIISPPKILQFVSLT